MYLNPNPFSKKMSWIVKKEKIKLMITFCKIQITKIHIKVRTQSKDTNNQQVPAQTLQLLI